MFFPLFVDLTQKEILIAGAGAVARRRIRALCGFAGHMTVVAPEVHPEIRELADSYPITFCAREFWPEDLLGKDFVLAATDDEALNREIYVMCRENGIPVNNCSDKTMCDFQFPSVIKDGDVVIGLNASGKNHRLVKKTRIKVEQALGITDGIYR